MVSVVRAGRGQVCPSGMRGTCEQAGRAAQDASRGRRRKARLRPVQWLGFLRTPLAREGEKGRLENYHTLDQLLDCTRLGVTALLLPQSGQPAARCPLGR